MELIQALLKEIITEGRKQGLGQQDIVRRAGLGDSTLSKAKAADDIRLSTLTRLANAVGLKLSLTTNKPNLEKIMDRNVFTFPGLKAGNL